jgi:hypothetical protein
MAVIQYNNIIIELPEIKYVLNTYLKILSPINLSFDIIKIKDDLIFIIFTFNSVQKTIAFKLVKNKIANDYLSKRLVCNTIRNEITNSNITYIGDKIKTIEFNTFDFFTIPFIELSRFEEYRSSDLDIHGRFKFKNSLAYHYKYFDVAIVDEYALLFKNLLKEEIQNLEFENKKSKIITTHDIDEIYRFSNFYLSIRTIIGDIILYRNILILLQSVRDFFKTKFNISKDPYLLSIYDLAKESNIRGLESVFFFMTSNKSHFDKGYNIDDLNDVIDYLTRNGCSIGIHPGYDTYLNFEEMNSQIGKMNKAINGKITKSRQHFLRFSMAKTLNILIENGIKKDYTLGYAEQEGFRSGTSHIFQPYDFENRKEYNIEIQPLIAMDVTLTEYKKYSDEGAFNALIHLYKKIDCYNGVFTILWHNTYVTRERKRFKSIYLKFLDSIEK